MQLGIFGLGVIGRGLALNFVERGTAIVAWDPDPKARAAVMPTVAVADSPADLVARLQPPRWLLLIVPAGEPVECLCRELIPLLGAGDVVIDGGNSYYGDTIARADRCRRNAVDWIGVGISGGEEGARHGPAFMAGASTRLFAGLRTLLEPVAARTDGTPCLALAEGDGAGHFLKAAHNAIEYAMLQVLAELYTGLRYGLGLDANAVHAHFSAWAAGPLASYLAESAASLLKDRNAPDAVRDRVAQGGTGAWAVTAGLSLNIPAPTLAAAVFARSLSNARPDAAARDFSRSSVTDVGNAQRLWGDAGVAAFACAFAQGFDLITAGAKAFGWTVDVSGLARSWRNGCIVRSAMLDTVADAASAAPSGMPLLSVSPLREIATGRIESLRAIVRIMAEAGLPAPTLASALAYLDALAGAPLGANLIALQRQRFGRHAVERAAPDTKKS